VLVSRAGGALGEGKHSAALVLAAVGRLRQCLTVCTPARRLAEGKESKIGEPKESSREAKRERERESRKERKRLGRKELEKEGKLLEEEKIIVAHFAAPGPTRRLAHVRQRLATSHRRFLHQRAHKIGL